MNRIKKLLTNYGTKRVDEISPFAHQVVNSTTASTFINNASDLVVGLKKSVENLDLFTQTHGQLTPVLTSELNTLRQAVLDQLSKVASSLNSDYAGNETALLSSGLELAADPQPVKPPGLPLSCELLEGMQSGTMLGRIKRAPGSLNVLWYYTTDPALPLGQWTCVLCNADELTIPGQKPGTRLYLRVACLNGASDSTNLLYAEAKPRYVE